MVRPAMVYGLETVAVIKKQVELEMEVAEMKMLRFAMGVTRKDKIRNEHIRSTVKARLQPFTVLFSFSAILVCFIDAQIHSFFLDNMSGFERQ